MMKQYNKNTRLPSLSRTGQPTVQPTASVYFGFLLFIFLKFSPFFGPRLFTTLFKENKMVLWCFNLFCGIFVIMEDI